LPEKNKLNTNIMIKIDLIEKIEKRYNQEERKSEDS